jgi:hypothetical protein
MSARTARLAAIIALVTFTLSGCANNVERSAKLECARLRHLAAIKAARVDRKIEASDCRTA